MDNAEKLTALGTQEAKTKTNQTENNMCLTPLYASKHK